MSEGVGTRFTLNILGMILGILGLAGCAGNDLAGMHLLPGRSVFHLLCGISLLCVTHWSTYRAARACSFFLTLLFGGAALAGFAFGLPVNGELTGDQLGNLRLWVIWKGHLELGRPDHIFHALLAGFFLYAAIAPQSWDEKQLDLKYKADDSDRKSGGRDSPNNK